MALSPMLTLSIRGKLTVERAIFQLDFLNRIKRTIIDIVSGFCVIGGLLLEVNRQRGQNVMRLPTLITTLPADRLRVLPLVVLYITDGCNSRCITCDIWKLPRRNMDMALVEQLAAEFPRLGVREVVLSGGEAMQHPEWPRIAQMFREAGAKVTLLTNGLALKKQAEQVIQTIDVLTVSLDGATPETYRAIRGVDALAPILEGMRMI